MADISVITQHPKNINIGMGSLISAIIGAPTDRQCDRKFRNPNVVD